MELHIIIVFSVLITTSHMFLLISLFNPFQHLEFMYETADKHLQSVYWKETHRNSVICLLRLAKKDDELRNLREELKEMTARWCTVVK